MPVSGKKLPRAEECLQAASDAGDCGTKDRSFSDIPGVLSRYAGAHRRALVMSDYARRVAKDKRVSQDLRLCGSVLLFRHFYTVDVLRLHSAKFCDRALLCPLCAIRRASRSLARWVPKFLAVLEASPDLRPYLVTLTVKDGPDLLERFRHLSGALSRQTQARRNFLKGRGPFVEFAKADGALYAVEFKRGKNSGLWHPHVHAVWLCSVPPDEFKLSEDWRRFTGDSFIVDSRPFYESKSLPENLLEVLKYPLKFSDLSVEDNWHAFKVLSARRLVGSIGSLYGLKLEDADVDDSADLDGLPYHDLLYKFFGGEYSFVPDVPGSDSLQDRLASVGGFYDSPIPE